MTEPTDAELWQLWIPMAGRSGVADPVDFARAVLQRWGQPSGEREPMTQEQIKAMSRKHPAEDLCGWSYRMGIADAEAHHGIKEGDGHGLPT